MSGLSINPRHSDTLADARLGQGPSEHVRFARSGYTPPAHLRSSLSAKVQRVCNESESNVHQLVHRNVTARIELLRDAALTALVGDAPVRRDDDPVG